MDHGYKDTVLGRVGVVVAAGALLLVGAAGAQTFTDPVGDTEGPDINSVSITHDADTLHVDVHFANRTRLRADEAVEIAVDLDGNARTGEEGVDLNALFIEGEPAELLLWHVGALQEELLAVLMSGLTES